MSLFNIGVAGLRAQQAALSTTGQNITNASTPGYSRQRVNLEADRAGSIGGAFATTQVRVEGVERIADRLVTEQVRSDQSLLGEMSTLVAQIEQVDSVLFRNGNGIGDAFNAFFAAIDAANVNPSATTERKLVLENGERLLLQLSGVQGQLEGQGRDLNGALSAKAEEITSIARGLADLNLQIGVARGTGNAGADNQLLDQRDELLRELSTLVGVKTIVNGDEQVSVFIGKGQALVLGNEASTLDVDARNEVLLRTGGDGREPVAITQSVAGGEMGGLLEFQNTVLRPTQQRIGQLALGFTEAFNTVHRNGVSLDGATGRDFFSGMNEPDQVRARVLREDRLTTTSAPIALTIQDISAVPLTDYRLSIAEDADGGYTLRRLSDGQVLQTGRVESLEQDLTFDGLSMSVDTRDLGPGQSYRLSPFGFAANNLSLVVSTGSELALAEGASTTASLANASEAILEASEVLGAREAIAGRPSTPDNLLIRFVTPDRFDVLDNTNPAAPVALTPPLRSVPFVAGQTRDLLNTEPGVTRITSDTLQVGKPQVPISSTDQTVGPPNGYLAQSLQLETLTAAGTVDTQGIALAENNSARASAEQLSVLPGVRATAYTDLQVSAISTAPGGTAPQVFVNGVELGIVESPETLVTAVNQSEVLITAGISAQLVDGRAVVQSAYGDDLTLAINAAPEAALTLVSGRGQEQRLQGQGVGDPPVLVGGSDLRGPISLSPSSDYSLFVRDGSGPAVNVSVAGDYASAADLVFDLQDKLDAAFGGNQVEVGLNPGGQLRLVSRSVGSTAALTVAPSAALGGLLGLSASTAQGNERYASTTVGGTVALELDAGVALRGLGAGPFAAQPVVSAPSLPVSLNLIGAPAAGDEFEVRVASQNPLGNAIGLELVDLQRRGIIGQTQDTLSTAVSETIEFVGIRGAQAQADATAAESLLAQSTARRESISGVNLDEEAANLIRYEQAYNASAQVISVARDIFNTLINAIA